MTPLAACPSPRPLGIIAGGGSLPREVADFVLSRGGKLGAIVALEGEADADFSGLPLVALPWGRVGGAIAALRRAGCRDLVFIGRVQRPSLLRLFRLKPDCGFFRALPVVVRCVFAGGDDALLRGVVRYFESCGFQVVSAAAAAPGLLAPDGPLGRFRPGPEEGADMALGFEAVRRLGPFDVGQGVVVAEGRLLAIEGVEGTDAMLARVAKAREQACSARGRPAGGVLVKAPKPGQDMRMDLPTVGPVTVERAAAAGLAGIAVLRAGTLIANRAAVTARADALEMFVVGVAPAGVSPLGAATSMAEGGTGTGREMWQVLARPFSLMGVSAQVHLADASKGASVIRALQPFAAGRCTVVVRRHVLAVEAGGEGAVHALERAAAFRPWGLGWARWRAGVAVLASGASLDKDVIEAAVAAGLAGIAIVEGGGIRACPVSEEMFKYARRRGLFLAAQSGPERLDSAGADRITFRA